MSVTYGFYNSLNGDRKYDAVQMSSIFDGIILDGIFMHVGQKFIVEADGSMTLKVGTGRAWFNHTWTLNDSVLLLTVDDSEVLLNRIDAVVIDVNDETRTNEIKIVKGTPSTEPVKPTLVKEDSHWQYPLCYISIASMATGINQANVENMVGTSDTPFVTGVLEGMNIDALIAQWKDEWRVFFDAQTADIQLTNNRWKAEWQLLYDAQKELMETTNAEWADQWQTWFRTYTAQSRNEFSTWMSNQKSAFNSWFGELQAILEPDVAANMANKIIQLENRVAKLEECCRDLSLSGTIWNDVYDNSWNSLGVLTDNNGENVVDENSEVINTRLYSSDQIVDSNGDPIQLRNILEVK